MNTCPNCGKMAGIHGSILQGCMCQYSMQAPPQCPVAEPHKWEGLTDDEFDQCDAHETWRSMKNVEAKLKEKNTRNGGCL